MEASLHLKILCLSFCNLIYTTTIYFQPFPTSPPCDLSTLKYIMMWWMIYDVILFTIVLLTRLFYASVNPVSPALGIAFLYVTLQISGGIVLFRTNNDCTLTHGPHHLLVAAFVNWLYRMLVCIGLISYAWKKEG